MYTVAHYYRNRMIIKREFEPGKKNKWTKNRVRPDDERCPRRDPEDYEFPEYDRMVEGAFFQTSFNRGYYRQTC